MFPSIIRDCNARLDHVAPRLKLFRHQHALTIYGMVQLALSPSWPLLPRVLNQIKGITKHTCGDGNLTRAQSLETIR